jgi:uncharacterized protein DUF927
MANPFSLNPSPKEKLGENCLIRASQAIRQSKGLVATISLWKIDKDTKTPSVEQQNEQSPIKDTWPVPLWNCLERYNVIQEIASVAGLELDAVKTAIVSLSGPIEVAVREQEEKQEKKQEKAREEKQRRSAARDATAKDYDARMGKPYDASCPYEMSDSGITWYMETREGLVEKQLTNFRAEIVADVIVDDGEEQKREFRLVCIHKGREISFCVDASQYQLMTWVAAKLGADALLYPGLSTKDHARFAVQFLSPNIERQMVYAHTGWRQINGVWAYLHAEGRIYPAQMAGFDGRFSGGFSKPDNAPANGNPLNSNVVTSVLAGLAGSWLLEGSPRGKCFAQKLNDALCDYDLPEPLSGADLQHAICRSLEILDVAPRPLTIPLYGVPWRAALAPGDFSVHVSGPTGHGKTALSAILQQHFGAAMNAQRLPANWTSSANSLEALAFEAKDALLVIDEFTPTDSTQSQALYRTAERIFRAVANRAGRQRMNADTTIRPTKPPRCFILSTGEDVPKGLSLRARMMILELEPDTVNFDKLTDCQTDAANGVYAQAMSGFIQWLAPQMDEVTKTWKSKLAEFRNLAAQSNMHRRTPENVASLMMGWDYFLRFACEVGAIDEDKRSKLHKDVWETLGRVALKQAAHQAAAEPATRFLDLLRDLLASGHVHLKVIDPNGVITGPDNPRGDCVGYEVEDGTEIYLIPEASFGAVQEFGRQTGDPVTVSAQTLRKRLHERGHLAQVDKKRETVIMRKTIDGKQTKILALYRVSLFAKNLPNLPNLPNQGCDDKLDGLDNEIRHLKEKDGWQVSPESPKNLPSKPAIWSEEPDIGDPDLPLGRGFYASRANGKLRCKECQTDVDVSGVTGFCTVCWQAARHLRPGRHMLDCPDLPV